MRRKEIKARSITQSNDATCHKATKRSKRNASKKARQAMQHEVQEAVDEHLSQRHFLENDIEDAIRKAIEAGYCVDLLGCVNGIVQVPHVQLRPYEGVTRSWARETLEALARKAMLPVGYDIEGYLDELAANGYYFSPEEE